MLRTSSALTLLLLAPGVLAETCDYIDLHECPGWEGRRLETAVQPIHAERAASPSAQRRLNTIVLDFEGIGNVAPVGNFYASLGVFFAPNALGIIDSDAGGTGNFANEPSPSTVLFFLTGSAVLNYPAGFEGGFSFFYTSFGSAVVRVYSEVNRGGSVLATLNLVSQFSDGCSGDPSGGFCNWTPVGASFAGVAKSIDFGGTVNRVGFDDITFGSATPGIPPSAEPSAEPSSEPSLEPTSGTLCQDGQENSDGTVCCGGPDQCDVCGGCNCASYPGGASQCCPKAISDAGIECVLATDTGCLLGTYVFVPAGFEDCEAAM